MMFIILVQEHLLLSTCHNSISTGEEREEGFSVGSEYLALAQIPGTTTGPYI